MTKIRNNSKMTFKDISKETSRTYHYPGVKQTIESPSFLNVGKNGGHRILDESGEAHYIPKGWIRLSWKTKEGKPHFID